mgnify:CR=1 FL=1
MNPVQLIEQVALGRDPYRVLAELLVENTSEGGFSLNCAQLSPERADAYARAEFEKAGQDIDDVLPDFDLNYRRLQKACGKALGIPRVQMPVIEPPDIPRFEKALRAGKIDLLAPWARGKFFAPTNLTQGSGEEWLNLGYADGSKTDDVIKAKLGRTPCTRLIPTQSQIWLEKLIGNIVRWGVPRQGSPITDSATLIISTEGYILDGHHRYGQAMLADPGLRMKTLSVPLRIDDLVAVGRSFGNAIGNQQKA